MNKKIFVFAAIVLVSLSACYYDVEEELYPNSANCTVPATVSFAQDINPILQSNGCINCHNSSGASGNVMLDSYASVKARVTDGRLSGSVNHLPGFSPMPKGNNKLSSCNLNKIKSWIDAGAPNN